MVPEPGEASGFLRGWSKAQRQGGATPISQSPIGRPLGAEKQVLSHICSVHLLVKLFHLVLKKAGVEARGQKQIT